jgi:AraC-like DNA-binding protein
MFPQGDAHVMSSAPGVHPTRVDSGWMIATRGEPKPIPVAYHGSAEHAGDRAAPDSQTTMVCGFLGCDVRPFNPLIATLPRLLHVPDNGEGAWVAQLMQQAVSASQAKRPGSEAVLERMSEMMFAEAVRRYVESLPEQSTGWLAGLRDRHVGRALALLHAEPARDWRIEALADAVALSRSAFYDRFVRLIGQPPMQYLAQWRMQVASNLLRQGHAPVASIALEVGYESEAAFSRAFKRAVGVPPAAWRRARDAAAT